MNILIIAVQYPPSTQTGAHRPSLLAKEFVNSGHHVTVLTQMEQPPSHGGGMFELTTGSFGERVVRIRPAKIPGIKDESFRCFWSMRTAIRRTQFLRNIDVAIITGPPFFHFFLVFLFNRLGALTILDYRDGWSKDPYPFRSAKDLIFRLLGRVVEPLLCRRASAVVFVSNSLRADYKTIANGSGSAQTFVITNSVDMDEFNSVPPRDLKGELGLPANTNLFVYVGSLSPDIGANAFASNLNILLRKKISYLDSSRFVIIGASTNYANYFDREILNRFVFFKPPVPLKESYACIKGADILLSLSGSHPQRLNRKIFEYAVASRPVLHVGEPNGETSTIVRHINGSVIVPSNDCLSLEQGLHTVLTYLASRALCANTNDEAVLFTSKQASASYLQIIADLKVRVKTK